MAAVKSEGYVRRMLLAAALALVLCGALPAALRAQSPCDSAAFAYSADSEDGGLVDAASLLPGFLRDQIFLKRFIRDPRFLQFRTLCGDSAAADAIFLRALEIADGDIRHALFVAMFGTMDHYKLGLRLPLFGVLSIPLTTESDSTFRVRHRNLPGHIMSDSIGRRGKDKDKLQHFFGSAFLAYFTHSPGVSTVMGNFIEMGEAAIVVGGANDERDKAANRLGREFGLRLLEGEELVPSDVLWRGRP